MEAIRTNGRNSDLEEQLQVHRAPGHLGSQKLSASTSIPPLNHCALNHCGIVHQIPMAVENCVFVFGTPELWRSGAGIKTK